MNKFSYLCGLFSEPAIVHFCYGHCYRAQARIEFIY